jgi:hypothetical protein
VECYRFICDNFSQGDEIILLGFSRGAFTARSVADMVCKLGILNRTGLQELPEIFLDYKTWHKWESNFDGKTHLTAFTPELLKRAKRLRRVLNGDTEESLSAEVSEDRNQLFNDMSNSNKTTLEKTKAYKEMLHKVSYFFLSILGFAYARVKLY